jgi:hypothetical protein
MKFSIATLSTLALASGASAFVPSSHTSFVVSSSTRLAATTASPPDTETETAATAEKAAAEKAVPPPLAPLTLWGDKITDIRKVQQEMKKKPLPEFAPEVSAKSLNIYGDAAAQLQYFHEHGMELKEKMEHHGAVIFRDFELMKTQDGFQQFYEAVGMLPCLDPLHSVSARPTVNGDKNSPVYEAVNKESRKNFFIGTYAYFSCSSGYFHHIDGLMDDAWYE